MATASRRQKLIVAVGGVVLLGLVAFQLPKLLSSGSKSDSATATPPPAAVPLAKPAVPVATPAEKAAKRSIDRLSERDVFVPQVQAGSGGGSGTKEIFPAPPAVREKTFVVKDPFEPQVVVPSAPVARPGSTVAVPFPDQTVKQVPADAGGTYVVVIGTVDGTSGPSVKAAARAVVAAKNAGLKDVVANDTLGPRSGPKAHFTIFTGPFSKGGLAAELTRAHRNGYPGAYSMRVDSTPIGGY